MDMIDALIQLGIYQWIGLLFGLLYIIFAIRNKPACWVFGIISCAAIAVEDFTKTRLYADGALQIFYIITGLWGLYTWKFGGPGKQERAVSTLERRFHYLTIGAGLAISFFIAWILMQYTSAAFPFLDVLTTVFSIIATIFLVYRFLYNWIYWIAIDAIYVFLYSDRHAPLFALLYVVFTFLSITGYIKWKKNFMGLYKPND